MKLPLSLIKSFVHLDLPPAQIAETLTLLGIEVDRIEMEPEPVLELSLTPNLGHCMSALGIARELSAALQLPLQKAKPPLKEISKTPIEERIHVSIQDPKLCPRYMCRLIEGVKIAPSPSWLQQILELCGVKPINNAVDVANYIMVKFGQPLHAFDYNLLDGKKIRVAPAEKPFSFLGLDEIEREIPAGTLLIWDAHKPVAIAGILGGANSAVSPKTTDILLEAAYFDPIAIRNGAKKTGVRTESSQRFEKGIDPVGIKEALDEAAQLIQQICGGLIVKGAIDEKKQTFTPKEIRCRADRVNHLLGTKLSFTEMEEIFQRLGFTPHVGEKGIFRVEVPLFRSDIAEEIDLIEEIARIYGYNNVERHLERCTHSQIPNDPTYLFEKNVRSRLAALGLTEFLTCDLISPKLAEIAHEIAPTGITFLKTLHSKSEEYSVLRTSLLPALLHVAKTNLDQKNLTFHAFEIGRIHFLQEKKVAELPIAALLLTGKATPQHWSHKTPDVDLFDLKGLLENLLESLNIKNSSVQPSSHISFHPGRQANLFLGDLNIGSFGEIHPSLLERFDIKQRIFYAELQLQSLIDLPKSPIRMTPIPQFPASQRDWTISLPLHMPINTLFQTIHSAASPLLENLELIDLYTPEGASEKNATFRFTYRDRQKTISFEEVEAEHAKLLQAVTQKN